MYQNLSDRKIIIVCGHYGSGKTNVAVNLAMYNAKTTHQKISLADVDIVNPYFRAADACSMLEAAGVRPLIPAFANSNVDIPSLPSSLSAALEDTGDQTTVYVDVGGDDGAVVLGAFSERIKNKGYEMLYVVNMYRPMSASPEAAGELMREIEHISGLQCSMIVNNSSLGRETTYDDVLASIPYAVRCAELCGLPLAFHAYYEALLPEMQTRLTEAGYPDERLLPMICATKNLF